ncbi:transcriptional regulator [Brachyspira sp. CAG:484]|nr:transcriptional regulator [Brachyspira sp. CAG:484]
MDNKEFLKKVGLKLKVIRSLRGISQDDIVNKLDIDKSYYSKVERGLTNPTLLYMKNLSDFLEVKLEDLLNLNMNI